MKHTTLKDLSKVLNISVSAVSKALKGYKDISDATRNEVLRMAEEMNYIPNLNAISLKTNQNHRGYYTQYSKSIFFEGINRSD